MASNPYTRHDCVAAASGGLTDIWQGEYYESEVNIKASRLYSSQHLKEVKEVSIQPTSGSTDKRVFQILWKGVPTWRRPSYQNILALCGVAITFFRLALVYDWGQRRSHLIHSIESLHPGISGTGLLSSVAA